METRSDTKTANSIQFYFYSYANDDADDDALVEKRINDLLADYSETARENLMFGSEREKAEAGLMVRPVSIERTYARFGALLGVFPPAAIFARVFFDRQFFQPENFWVFGIFCIVSLISATVGYFSGKKIGRTVFELEKMSWTRMILTLPFLGAVWGILAGGAGGIIIFVFGAFFGALVGGAVGAVALPVFTVVHRLIKRGDQIEEKHFLPLAYGVAAVISAFVIGL